MRNVQACRSDDDATVSFPAVPVICRASVVETDPQCPAAVAVGALAAVIGEARDTRATSVQNSIGLPEIGAYRSNRRRFAQRSGVVFVKRDPGLRNITPAPMATR